MKFNKEKGLQAFKGLLTSTLMASILVTGLGVTAYAGNSHSSYDNYNYILGNADSQPTSAIPVGIRVGQNMQLDFEATGGVRWISSNPGIVSVNEEGVITAVSSGNTLVLALAESPAPGEPLYQYFDVTVLEGPHEVISQMRVGQSKQLYADIDGDVIWILVTPGIVAVNDTGYVTARQPGTGILLAVPGLDVVGSANQFFVLEVQ